MRANLPSIVTALLILAGCSAHRKPYDQVRVAVLGFESSVGATMTTRDGVEKPVLDKPGIMAVLEKRLLKNNITVVDDAEIKAVLSRMKQGEETGVHTTASTVREYQPAATHGVFIKVQENIGLLTAFSLGIIPRSVDLTARLVDMRTGEVRASTHGSAYGSVYSSRAAYSAARKLADQMAEALADIQEKGRHLRSKDWPSNFQTLDTDPTAAGRYNQALIMVSGEFYDETLKALTEAVRLDKKYAELAQVAPEFEPIRETAHFQAIVGAGTGVRRQPRGSDPSPAPSTESSSGVIPMSFSEAMEFRGMTPEERREWIRRKKASDAE